MATSQKIKTPTRNRAVWRGSAAWEGFPPFKISKNLKRSRSSSLGRRQSIPILHSGTMFRNGIMQLMNHTLENLPEGESEDERSYRSGSSPMAQAKHQHVEGATPNNNKVVDRRSSQVEEIVSWNWKYCRNWWFCDRISIFNPSETPFFPFCFYFLASTQPENGGWREKKVKMS